MIGWLLALLAGAPAAPAACSFEAATATSVREMAHDPERWFGRCVRLSGLVEGYVYYADVAGLYRRHATDKEDRPNDGWLGLYFTRDRDWIEDMREAVLVGVVTDCGVEFDEARASAGPDAIVMMVGYCHYQGGLVLNDVTIRHGRRIRLERQMGEAARAAFGDLEPAYSGDKVPAEVARLVDAYVAAFRAADVTAIERLIAPYDFLDPEKRREKARLRRFLTGEEGAFRPFRKGEAAMRPTYFRQRLSARDIEALQKPDWFACFCKTTDCGRSWPVASIDAKAHSRRPYACLRTFAELDEDALPLRLGVEREGLNLPEPD